VTPAGIGREAFWQGIQEPVSRVRLLHGFEPEAGHFIGAEVPGFRLGDYAPGVTEKRVPRHTQFAVAAAMLAMKDAGLQPRQLGLLSTVIQIGSSLMDFGVINKTVEIIRRRGPVNAIPSSIYSASVAAIGGAVAELVGGTVRTLSLQSACCAGLDSIGHAAAAVARGEAQVAICGGTEAPMHFHPMLELKMAGLAPGNPERPEKQSRPFDLWRTTGAIGEGACVLILEPEDSPRPGYAFVDGYSYVTDPADRLCEGLYHSMRLAIADAGMRPDQVDAISAVGPGHRLIDAAEAAVIERVFGGRTREIATVSLKGALGNPLGANGAIQAAAAALSIHHSVVPPTVNWEFPDPSCPLSLSNTSRFLHHRVALVNTRGLSGTNACLVLQR
jgi:3-oxoacyl-(acyl-carrier-protein) synthase